MCLNFGKRLQKLN